jgi:hypothetical protein
MSIRSLAILTDRGANEKSTLDFVLALEIAMRCRIDAGFYFSLFARFSQYHQKAIIKVSVRDPVCKPRIPEPLGSS